MIADRPQTIVWAFTLCSPTSIWRVMAAHATRQGQPKKCISAQRDMMDLKGTFFVFEPKMTLDRS